MTNNTIDPNQSRLIKLYPWYTNGIKQLKSDEGFREKVYKDSKNKSTIGYGFNTEDPLVISEFKKRNIPVNNLQGYKMDKNVAESILHSLSNAYLSEINQKYPYYKKLPSNQQEVIYNMYYNLGYNKFNKFNNFQKALVNQKKMDMAREMMDSNWYSQVTNRANRLINKILYNDYNSKIANPELDQLQLDIYNNRLQNKKDVPKLEYIRLLNKKNNTNIPSLVTDISNQSNLDPRYNYYKVRKGDILSKVFPNNWREISKLNNLKDPNKIYIGQQLKTGLKTINKQGSVPNLIKIANRLREKISKIKKEIPLETKEIKLNSKDKNLLTNFVNKEINNKLPSPTLIDKNNIPYYIKRLRSIKVAQDNAINYRKQLFIKNRQLDKVLDTIFKENPKYFPYGLSRDNYNLDKEDEIILITDDNNENIIKGFVGVQKQKDKNNPNIKSAYYSIGILPEFRNKGLAEKALSYMIKKHQFTVDKNIYSVVENNTPSLKVYNKLKEKFPIEIKILNA